MRVLPLPMVIVLAFSLAGCWKEQRQSLNYCATHIPYHSKYSPWAHVQTPMTRCMDKQGYHVEYENMHCAVAGVPRRSPYCYTPKGWLSAIAFRLEMLYQPGPEAPEAR